MNKVETNDMLVRAPLSDRANVILANLLEECPIVNGAWTNGMDCAAVQSTAFGYYVGTRRHREDLVQIGRVSARNESRKVRHTALRLAMGEKSVDYKLLQGFPALFIASLFEPDGIDYFLFGKCLDTMTAGQATDNNIVVNTFVAYFSALRYRAEANAQERYLETARVYANSVRDRGFGAFAAFAYGSVAKASEDPNDVTTARKIIESALPQFFDMETKAVRVAPNADCLSWIEAMISALADMAQMDPAGPWRQYAIDLLNYIFSDRYFNGQFLVHHINRDGTQADTFCSGCNFAALILADRLYGDSLVFDAVKPPKVLECRLEIVRAFYGGQKTWRDASEEVRKRIKNNRLSVYVSNELVGDPLPGETKHLYITYRLNGREREVGGSENSWLSLP